MLGARASLGLLLTLLVFAPVAFAQQPYRQSCWWCWKIEKQLDKLQQQINKLTALWFPNISDHERPLPGSYESTSTRYSKTFGSPGVLTDLPYYTPTKDSELPVPTATMGGGEGYRSVAYFVNWGIYGRKYFPQTIPADKLTHVLYAFGDNREDGEVVMTDPWSDVQIHYEGDSWNDQGNNLYGNLKQLNVLKKKNRNMKVLLSIGGWTYTNVQKHFDGPASTPQGRKKFANTCVQHIKNLGFDGIDLDWEYPQNPEQGQHLLLLLQEIRSAMDAYADKLASESDSRPHFVLSIAAPAGEQNYKNLPLGALARVLDFINLMCYDFTGSWETNSGHQANLYHSASCPTCTPFNINSVIDVYISQGVPSDKIVMGMPLYGRSFANTTGIGKPFQGVGEGSWEQGVWDFKALPQPGAQEHLDEEAGASYSYDNNTKSFVTYDTLPMALRKAHYIKQKHLGGAMWWELSGDRQDNGSIITNVVKELGGYDCGKLERSQNCIHYPDSQYDNMRAGFPNN